MMYPVSKCVLAVKASSSFYTKCYVVGKVIYLAIFCCLATTEVASRQLFEKKVLNSIHVENCFLVQEKHKSGTGFVLFSHCH